MTRTKQTFYKVIAVFTAVMILLSAFPLIKSDRVSAEEGTGVEINAFAMTLVSGAEPEDGGYVWHPQSSNAGHRFLFRVTYSFSGRGTLKAGEVTMTVPKNIIRARNGRFADKFEMSLPERREASSQNPFAYRVSGSSIIIQNVRTISAAQNGYFELSYETTKSTLDYEDMSLSDECQAALTVSRNGYSLSADTDPYRIAIDTSAGLFYLHKSSPDVFSQKWKPSWGTAPENADAYYYLEWTVTSYIYATQPYYLSYLDEHDGQDSFIVGYKLSGDSEYTLVSSSQNNSHRYSFTSPKKLRDSGYRFDKVITRHSKLTYEPLEQYSLENNIRVKLTPADDIDDSVTVSASGEYIYDTPVFVYPYGNWNSWQYGTTSWQEHYGYEWDVADYRLEEFKNGDYSYLDGNIKYCIYTIGMPYPRTLEQNADMDDYRNYGKKSVNYTITNDKYYYLDNITTKLEEITVPEGTQTITGDDYEIEYLNFYVRINDAVFDESSQRFKMSKGTFNENDIIYFDAKFGDGGDWIENVAWYNLSNGENGINSDYVSGVDKKTVRFKSGCTAYRVRTSNAHYRTQMEVLPYCKLKRSAHILELTGDRDKVWLTSRSDYNVTDAYGNSCFYKDIIARDYITGMQKKTNITKTVTGIQNNKTDELAVVNWKAEVEENCITADGLSYIPQETGVFYDLLPLGCELIIDSVAVQNEEDKEISESDIDVSVQSNYAGTGRTLMTVRIKTIFNKAVLTYSTNYSWESMVDYGIRLLNSIAYETGNEMINDGFPDNGGEIIEADLLAHLDPGSVGNRFQYAEHKTVVDVTRSSTLGLMKTVKVPEDSSYKTDTRVHQGGEYTYRLRYVSSLESNARNMIFFDSLENYSEPGIESSFHGTLRSVDVSQLESIGAAPVVYYSDIEGLDLTEKPKLDEERGGIRVWRTESEFGDISRAKAIAVDASKNADGDDFILQPSRSAVVLINMTAPMEDTSEGGEGKSYNEVYLFNTIVNEGNDIEDYYISHKYTFVTFRISSDISLLKTSTEDDETFVRGVAFTLKGTSDYDNEVNKTLLTDQYGKLTFRNVEKGEYTLTETSGNDDYQRNPEPMTVLVDNVGDVYINGSGINKGEYYHISDEPRIHADVEFYKRDKFEKTRLLNGAEFELTGNSDYGNEITMYAVSRAGRVVFKNVEKGKYYVRETKAPKYYQLGKTVYRVEVDEAGVVTMRIDSTKGEPDPESLEQSEYGAYTVYNESLHSFTLVKVGFNFGAPVEGAVFTLSGTSYNGTSYELEQSTASDGSVTFSSLESGVYVLTETEAPYGYQLDSTPRVVEIDNSGSVTIEGLSKNEYGDFIVKNKETGSVTIVKKWVDRDSSSRYENGGAAPSPGTVISSTLTALLDNADPAPRLPNIIVSTDIPENHAVFDGVSGRSVLSRVAALTEIKTFAHFAGAESYVSQLISDGDAVRIDDGSSDYSIYAWFDSSSKTLYWWSDARRVYLSDSSHALWCGLTACTSIDTDGIDTAMLTDFSRMFKGCSSVTELDLSSFRTTGAVNMQSMFENCSSLVFVDMSSFDTSNVRDMSRMFYGCGSMEDIVLTNFRTPSLTTTESMFENCAKLSSLDLSGFDMTKNTSLRCTFRGCAKLESIDLSGLTFPKVRSMYCTFYECKALRSLDLSNTETGLCTDFESTFEYCSALTSLDLTNFDTSSALTMTKMFSYCSALPRINVSSFNTAHCTDFSRLFSQCLVLEEIDVSDFDVSEALRMNHMFNYCQKLRSVDLSNFRASKCREFRAMFQRCILLETIDFTGFDTSSAELMNHMFNYCTALKSLDLRSFDTHKVTDMRYMFCHCESAKTIDVSSFDTSSVTNMYYMFIHCDLLEELDLSSFNTSNVTDMGQMFSFCYALKRLDVSSFDVSRVTNLYAVFGYCTSLEELDVSSFYTKSATDMEYMFGYLESIEELDLSGFVLDNVTKTKSMFSHSYSLRTIYVSELWDISGVADATWMFNLDSLLQGENGTMCTVYADTKGYAHIDTEQSPGYLSYRKEKITPVETVLSNKSYFAGGNEDDSVLEELYDVNDILAFRHFDGDRETARDIIASCDVKRIDDGRELCPPIYTWLDSDGTLYWYSDAALVYLTDQAHCLFRGLSACESISLESIDTSLLTDASRMFEDCSALREISLESRVFTAVTNADYMFCGCGSLEEINLVDFLPTKLLSMKYMFNGCASLSSLVLPFATGSVTDFDHAFSGCSSLTVLDLSVMDTHLAENMNSMFSGCSSLERLDISRFDTSCATDMSYMFENCERLTSLETAVLDTSHASTLEGMFRNCARLSKIAADGFDVSGVIFMGSMFEGCEALTVLDLAGFSPVSATDMSEMFSGCGNLKTIYADDSWSTASLNSSMDMFRACQVLKGGNGTEFDNSRIDGEMAFIDEEGREGYLSRKGSSTDTATYTTADDNCQVEILDDNTWVFTFAGLDPNIPYYVWEEDYSGYTSTNPESNFTVLTDGTTTITNYSENDPPPDPEYGSLSVTKRLTGSGIDADDLSRTFLFTITLTDAQDQPLEGTAIYGKTAFRDGVARVRLNAAQTAVFTQIPAGYNYTVTEEAAEGFETVSENSNGTITADNTSEAVFTNNKLEITEAYNSFTLKKLVAGRFELNNAGYEFAVSFSGLRAGQKYHLSDGGSFTADEHGQAIAYVELTDGGTVTFLKLPTGSKYRITEQAGAYVSSYNITNGADEGFIKNGAAFNTEENRTLSTSLETVDEGEDILVTFTNTRDARQDLTVTKTVENASEDSDELFSFVLELTGLAENETIKTNSYGRFRADSAGRLRIDFFMSNGDKAIFYDLPVGAKYTVTEEACEHISSYVMTDSGDNTHIVTVADNNDEANKELSTALETVNEGERIVVAFTNRKVQHDLTLTKLVDMTDGTETLSSYRSREFEFTVVMRELTPTNSYALKYTDQDTTGTLYTESFTSDESGSAVLEIKLAHGQSCTFKNLPVGASYRITEKGERHYLPTYRITANEGAVIVTGSAAGTKTNVDLSTGSELVENNDLDVRIVFTNKYLASDFVLPSAGREDSRYILAALCALAVIFAAAFVLTRRIRRKGAADHN